MHLVTFIIAAVFILVSVIYFVRGLIRLSQGKKESSLNSISTGFMIGLVGIVCSVITTCFFNV